MTTAAPTAPVASKASVAPTLPNTPSTAVSVTAGITGIPVPRILQDGELDKLNRHLIQTTKCFAFLETNQVLFSRNPVSWDDAFSIYCVGLYAVYHDYGCKFLDFFLDWDVHPTYFGKQGSCSAEDQDTITLLTEHIHTVERILRPNIAHGVLGHGLLTNSQRREVQYYLDKFALSSVSVDDWPKYTNSIAPQNWKLVVEDIVAQSDRLYNFLWDWGSAWSGRSQQLKDALQRQFMRRDSFIASFDGRVCKPLLDEALRNNPNTTKTWRGCAGWQSQLKDFYWHTWRTANQPSSTLYRELKRLIDTYFAPPPPPPSSVHIMNKYMPGYIS